MENEMCEFFYIDVQSTNIIEICDFNFKDVEQKRDRNAVICENSFGLFEGPLRALTNHGATPERLCSKSTNSFLSP